MKDLHRLIGAAVLGALAATAANSWAQPASKVVVTPQMACWDAATAVMERGRVNHEEDVKYWGAIGQEFAELRRENTELKTLILATSR